jgi:hypothetical protein
VKTGRKKVKNNNNPISAVEIVICCFKLNLLRKAIAG